MWFQGKTKQNERDITEFISKVVLRLVDVEAKLEKYKQDIDSLRGLVNRKLRNFAEDDPSESDLKHDQFAGVRGLGLGT